VVGESPRCGGTGAEPPSELGMLGKKQLKGENKKNQTKSIPFWLEISSWFEVAEAFWHLRIEQ